MNSELYAIIIAAGAVAAALIILFAMRTRRKREEPEKLSETEYASPPKSGRSITTTEAKEAKTKLRTMGLEREILSNAIRRLYEAQAEGEINPEERERLAKRYKERMYEIKNYISRSESVVALHELEETQEDLIKLFNNRFDELNEKIEGVRSSLGMKHLEEAPTAPPTPIPEPSERREARAPRRRRPPKKTEAEKRIEEIKAEVEKVLQRLGQIEAEE
ncbi:MAG: hypothetical protein JSW53_05510 [Candidatus Bathyarchaeota archaeon]|nr:MAG: hypothetical protein JSW53_05510 [Candidatus Bathyarchaeota archaeon]